LNVLITANPQIPNPDLIFPGQVIFVPHRKVAKVVEVIEEVVPVVKKPVTLPAEVRTVVEVQPTLEVRPTLEVKPKVELKPTLEFKPTLELKPEIRPEVKPVVEEAMPSMEVPLFEFPPTVRREEFEECDLGLPRTHLRPCEEEEFEQHRGHHHRHHHHD
jgi:hypothetical protein